MATGKKFERIADDLRAQIRTEELSPGEKLPSETKLAKEHATSVPTVRQALALLQAEGMIEKEHGRGNFVRRPRRLVSRANDRHQWEKDRVRSELEERSSTGATERDTGLDVDALVFSAKYTRVEADAELAEALGVGQGAALLERIYRTRHQDERAPFNLVRSYMPVELIEGNPDLLDEANEPWPGGTQSQLHTVGIELDRVVERVTARPPTAEESEELDLSAGIAVMVIEKSSIDTHDRVADWSEVVLPGDRTASVFTTKLERW
ncbi:GntR family transcriptional regulator [Nocardiopsis kunsanensis]|uniref:GntR family transcriptional regulator n=1 Tax=Nocardiopsis kunsanensis TaxID=141693 RepID=UPI00034BF3AE|nr:GntR family transcriptional regulator [Nocardiopsis kunsanensis]